MKIFTDLEDAIGRFQHSKVLGIDIETTMIPDDKPSHWVGLRVVSFSDGQDSAVLHYPDGMPPQRLIDFLSTREKLVTFFGTNFDLPVLMNLGLKIEEGQHFDCYVASRIMDTTTQQLHSPGRHSLSGTMERFLGESYKTKVNHLDWSNNELTLDQLEYSSRDVEFLPLMSSLMTQKAEQRGMRTALNMEQVLTIPVAHINRTGIPASIERFERMIYDELRPEAEILEIEIEAFADMMGVPGFTVTKTKKMVELLRDKLGMTLRKTPKGADSVNHASLMGHTSGEGGQVVKDIIRLKQLTRAMGKTAIGNHTQSNGHVYAVWDQTGTLTRRFTTHKPNVLGISAKYDRPVLGMQEGMKVVAGDFSQIELHVGAHLSKDAQMKQDLKGDVYVEFAKYGFNISEVSKDARQAAKICILAGNYGGGAGVVMDNYLDITGQFMPHSTALNLMKRRDARWPKMAKFRKDWGSGSKGLSVTLKGGYVCGVEPGTSTNPLSNYPVQGNAAILLKMAIIDCYREGLCPRFPIAPYHDELAIFSVPDEETSIVEEQLREIMLNNTAILFPGAEPKVEVVIDSHWAKG